MSRIAVLHEWFAPIGGSEQVSLEMARALDADLWCLWDEDPGRAGMRPRQSRLATMPSVLRDRRLAMPLTPWIWRHTSTPRYDVVVTSSHGLGHTAKLPSSPDATYLSYVHSPARYVWTPELDARGAAWYLAPARAAVKRLDVRTSRHVASYAANSEEVRLRIREFWGVDAVVIPPPVDTVFYSPAPDGNSLDLPHDIQAGEYLLAAGRWVPYKRFDLTIDIASRARMPLVIAGGGPEEQTLRAAAASAEVPVTFVPDPSREGLRELLRGAAALLFPGLEDFGMVPVEAMACGTPVVALNRGGALETVVEGVSGAVVPDDLNEYVRAIPAVVNLDRAEVRATADRFSIPAFDDRVRSWVSEVTG